MDDCLLLPDDTARPWPSASTSTSPATIGDWPPMYKDHPPAPTSTSEHDEEFTQEGTLMDRNELHPSTAPSDPRLMSPARPGGESASSAGMFATIHGGTFMHTVKIHTPDSQTWSALEGGILSIEMLANREVTISGGTFLNVAHIYTPDSPAWSELGSASSAGMRTESDPPVTIIGGTFKNIVHLYEPKSPILPGLGYVLSARMFGNREVTISGGTFVTVAHIYTPDSRVWSQKESASSAGILRNPPITISGGTFRTVEHIYKPKSPACAGLKKKFSVPMFMNRSFRIMGGSFESVGPIYEPNSPAPAGAAPAQEVSLPASAATTAEHAPPTHHSSATRPAHEDYPPAPTSTNGEGEVFTQMGNPNHLTNRDELRPRSAWSPQHSARSPARPRRGGPSSAAMFTNAQGNKIAGCTFHNVAHNYGPDAPAPAGVSVLQFAGLASLQVTSTASLQYYLHSNHPQVAPPLVMASPSTVDVALHFPSLYREVKIMGTFALWAWFIGMWIRRGAI
ncbi:hypothetical protein D9619_002145 [Psilocybe cf. subviscida]|uniref:Uncharacterized protein n=1 Tax=Psilocybe cf. subviscida TaxID=2480587 RepID=A0A8H5BDU3_9AGAR|nr:hypothetical protein D9619_002145 [Psilocybe cf. subviscida]